MRWCKKCVMPDTRPGIKFDENGVCYACRNHEKKQKTDYNARWKELEILCDKYRGSNGCGYDCMIAVSGGKDSHYQTYIFKEKLKMNPLLVSVEDNFTPTRAGSRNLKNISEAFGCDIISLKPNLRAQKIIGRYCFERYAKPTYILDRYIYTYPLHMALRFNTPLLIYGENIGYEYSGSGPETYSAKEQLKNGVASGIEKDEILEICEFRSGKEQRISQSELVFFDPPSPADMEKLDPIYLSYFVPWNSYNNYQVAKKLGFSDLVGEWERSHHLEQFDQIDSAAYLVHCWLKYPKFGHGRVTDYASQFIRYGMLSRDDAIKLVKEKDHDLDSRCIREFCEFYGYSVREFYEILDRHYNKDLFYQLPNLSWKLKKEIE